MRIAVIGAGPAGSTAAARLAGLGHDVWLFDRTFDREKPCGGGVTWKSLRTLERLDARASSSPAAASDFMPTGRRGEVGDSCLGPIATPIAAGALLGGVRPVQAEAGAFSGGERRLTAGREALPEAARITRVVFESAGGRKAEVELPRPLSVFSRRELDRALLRRAEAAGARPVEEAVVALERARHGWEVRLAGGASHAFDHVVGADGARSRVRRTVAAAPAEADLSQAVGWYVPGRTSDTATVRFDARIKGYLWIFPRIDHLAVGACAPLAPGGADALWSSAGALLASLGLPADGLPRYSALIPSFSPSTLAANPVEGPGWSLVGDAAGTVDPLTREGIGYAIRSADMLGDAFGRGTPREYGSLWAGAFAQRFAWAGARRERFFDPELTDRLVRYLDRSRAIRRVMANLILGEQDYLTLKRRLLRTALPAGIQMAISLARIGEPRTPSGAPA
jgi:flavin-dependent dehydrogenase